MEIQRDQVRKCRGIRYGNIEESGTEMYKDQVRKYRGISYGNAEGSGTES